MTFEEALDALWIGQIVRRHGWEDSERLAYLVYNGDQSDHSVFSANVSLEDSLCDDWYVWGWIQ